MSELTNHELSKTIIRLTELSKLIRRKKRNVLREIKLLESQYNAQILIQNKGPTSPYFVNVLELIRVGYIQDQILISKEAKILSARLDSIEERVAELEVNE